MQKLLIGSLLTIAVLCNSCEKILDIKPTDFVSDATLWEDVNLVTQYVNNIYGSLESGFTYRDFPGGQSADWSRGLSILAVGCDEAEGKHDAYAQYFNIANMTPAFSPYNEDIWPENYALIRKCNVLLNKIDKLKGNEEIVTRYKAEATFLRAFAYFELIKWYGGVPLILKEQSLNENLYLPKNSYEECIRQIVKDCDSAASILPLKYKSSEVGHATKGAALALKARALLYFASPLNNEGNDLKRWEAAAEAAKQVMDLKTYTLYPDYYKLFLVDNNSEVIFDRQFIRPEIMHQITFMLGMSAGLGDGTWGGFSPTQDLVDAFEMDNGLPITDPASGYNPRDPYKNRDSRFYNSILYNGCTWKGQVIEAFMGGKASIGRDLDATTTGYGLKKFMDETILTIAQVYQGADNNWIFFRYGEILLDYAEAQNEAAGPDASVYDAINQVRSRADQPDLPEGLSQSEMRERIINERRVELVFEEHRFWDVRRWKLGEKYFNAPVHLMRITKNNDGTFSHNIEVLENRVFYSYNNLLPIPQFERDKNPNLEQNTGY